MWPAHHLDVQRPEGDACTLACWNVNALQPGTLVRGAWEVWLLQLTPPTALPCSGARGPHQLATAKPDLRAFVMQGRDVVGKDDIMKAIQLVILPRAMVTPPEDQPPPDNQPPPPPPPPQNQEQDPEDEKEEEEDDEDQEEDPPEEEEEV